MADPSDPEMAEPAAPAIASGTTVAVTGATGFIGMRLVDRLVEQGASVTCLTRVEAASRIRRTDVTVRALDLSDPDPVRAALRGIDVVIHCGYDWDDTLWNLGALRALIGACRANGCRRLVHVSSFVVYQIPAEGEVTEETPPTTDPGGYAHTKLALERDLLRAVRDEGVPGTIVQPTIVYGPASRPWTIDPADMLRHGTVVLPDSGGGICNAVYVDDVVSAIILAAVHPDAPGQRFLVSGPEPVTWRHFYEAMAVAADARGPQYRPASAIADAAAGGKARKLLRMAADPERLVRSIAFKGPVRRLIWAGSGRLPAAMRDAIRERLYGRETRRAGQVHLPDAGRLAFLQGRATIRSQKARQALGYAPAFDLEKGMVPTGRYLRTEYTARS